MSQKNNEKLIMFVITLGSLGLIAEIVLMGWELWVPCFIIIGVVALWGMSLSERIEYDIRVLV